MRIALLLLLYLALTLLPLLLSAGQDAPRRARLDELSTGMAMAGFAILLAEFALSGRWRALSRGVGMDLTMRFHQWMALGALAFLFAHPVLYTDYGWRPGPGGGPGAVRLTPAATVSGMLAWLVLVLLVVFAWARRHVPWSYEAWRLSHGIGALLLAALGAHHALDTGHYSQQPWLRGFWLAATGLAALTLVRVYLVKPLLQPRWRVAAVSPEAERLWRVVVEPEGARPAFGFAAGQFAWLKLFRALGRITEHPFSIASAPGQLPRLQFLVKEAGDFTGAIGGVAPGTRAYLDGPYGNFTLAGRAGTGLMLIAGGVGIAPILSLARDLAATGDPRPLKIVYADRSEAQLAARGELESMCRAPGRELHLALGAHLDAARLQKLMPPEGADRWLYFVCGPPAMIDAVELSLARLGVPLRQIVSERFVYDTGIATPREKLTRAVILAVILAQALAVLGFALR
jgi:predicted ferric reductase